ncbi:MAG: helix-turn-helix transcriptional regulator [Clostridia bacterium]|nr:helix-turn-helix transcriptional regulator [Clostridia bacterium]
MNIGNRIRELRKKKGLTQEQLASSINISFQAISKWENNIALPDITMMPILAVFFGISMDELFDFNLKEIEEDIEKIVDEAYKYRETDYKKGRQILEEGLKKYPNNEILLNNLLYVLNCRENPDETIKVASYLTEHTKEMDIKYDALRFLSYALKEKGDIEGARKALEQIPEIYFTKLSELAFLLTGKEKLEAADKQKWISFENLIQMMWKIAECYEANGETEKAIEETMVAIKMIELLGNLECFKNYVEFFNKQIQRMSNK